MNIENLRIHEDYVTTTTIFTLMLLLFVCYSWWHQIFETDGRNVERRTEVLHVFEEERWHTVSLHSSSMKSI